MYNVSLRSSRKQHCAKPWSKQWRRAKKCTFDHKKIKKNTKKTRVTSFYRHYFAYHCCCVIGHLKFFELFFLNFYKGAALCFFFAQKWCVRRPSTFHQNPNPCFNQAHQLFLSSCICWLLCFYSTSSTTVQRKQIRKVCISPPQKNPNSCHFPPRNGQ